MQERLVSRWQALRAEGGPLSDRRVAEQFSKQKQLLRRSVARNLNKWPLGSVSTQDNRIPMVGTKGTWQGEVDSLQQWVTNRMQWCVQPPSLSSSERVKRGQEVLTHSHLLSFLVWL